MKDKDKTSVTSITTGMYTHSPINILHCSEVLPHFLVSSLFFHMFFSSNLRPSSLPSIFREEIKKNFQVKILSIPCHYIWKHCCVCPVILLHWRNCPSCFSRTIFQYAISHIIISLLKRHFPLTFTHASDSITESLYWLCNVLLLSSLSSLYCNEVSWKGPLSCSICFLIPQVHQPISVCLLPTTLNETCSFWDLINFYH